MTAPGTRFDVLCLGGANADGDFRFTGPTILGTSNPATSNYSFGGVARNVAENLARVGVRTALASHVGADSMGWELVDAAAASGIDVSNVRIVEGQPTSRYLSLHGNDGTFVLGISSMETIDAISPADVVDLPFAESRWVFIDTNLAPNTLRTVIALREELGFPLALDAVSVPKARRLPRDLAGIDVLFANADEANAILSSAEPETPEGGVELAKGLLDVGATTVSVSLGEHGAAVGTPDGIWHVSVAEADFVNTTGTGDARIAGTLLRLISGHPLQEAARTGSLLAAIAAESWRAIHPDLSAAWLAAQGRRLDGVVTTQVE